MFALSAAVACGGSSPQSAQGSPEPGAGTAAPNAPDPLTALSIVTVASADGPSGSAWQLPSGTRRTDVRVTLDGRGTVTVRITLRRDGEDVHDDTQVHQLEGEPLELTFGDVGEFDRPGRYTLIVEAAGLGLRQRSEVSITRR